MFKVGPKVFLAPTPSVNRALKRGWIGQPWLQGFIREQRKVQGKLFLLVKFRQKLILFFLNFENELILEGFNQFNARSEKNSKNYQFFYIWFFMDRPKT
jgi:hypothetical protein